MPNPDTLTALYGLRWIFQLWNGALDRFGVIPQDGTLLKEVSGPLPYQMVGGHKVQVPALPDNAAINVLWDGALAQIP